MAQPKSTLKKKIVVIGGGNGSATSINALKKYRENCEISAVVSMSDAGGSSGKLRREFGTLPPGDIMRAILAMSPHDYPTLKKIFHTNRFNSPGKLAGHNLGNLFLVLAEKYGGEYLSAMRAMEQAVEAAGRVYPATLDKTDLAVELNDGRAVKGEDKIDRPENKRNLRIKKAWLEPVGKIYPEAKKVITQSDYIILGPGSLYTSVVAALLPRGVKEAIAASSAKMIYVFGGARETSGELGPRRASEFFSEIENYLPRPLDYVLRNNHISNKEELKYYKKRGWERIEFDKEHLGEYNIIEADFEKSEGGLCPEKLGEAMVKILDFRF